MNSGKHAPWWFVLLLVVLALPMLVLGPQAARLMGEGSAIGAPTASWLYPVYVCALGLCSWMCWGQRRTLAWILAALMALSSLMLSLTLI